MSTISWPTLPKTLAEDNLKLLTSLLLKDLNSCRNEYGTHEQAKHIAEPKTEEGMHDACVFYVGREPAAYWPELLWVNCCENHVLELLWQDPRRKGKRDHVKEECEYHLEHYLENWQLCKK